MKITGAGRKITQMATRNKCGSFRNHAIDVYFVARGFLAGRDGGMSQCLGLCLSEVGQSKGLSDRLR